MTTEAAYPDWRSSQPVDPDRPPIFWVEHELDEEPWTAAYGLVTVDGSLAVAEVRLFPTRSAPAERSSAVRQRKRAIGEWSRDPALVPPGGIPTRVVRSLQVPTALRVGLERVLRTDTPAGNAGLYAVRADRQPSRPRKRRRDPRLLARVAVLYEQALSSEAAINRKTGRHSPNEFIYRQLRGTDDAVARRTVEALVRAARDDGYLVETRGRGRAGGTATKAAHDLVDQDSAEG